MKGEVVEVVVVVVVLEGTLEVVGEGLRVYGFVVEEKLVFSSGLSGESVRMLGFVG